MTGDSNYHQRWSSILITGFLVALMVSNVIAAKRCNPNHRLRWYLATQRPLSANRLLRDDDVHPNLGWLSDDGVEVLPGGSAVAGQFASVLLPANTPIARDAVSPVPVRKDQAETVIFPVHVRADSIPGLNPSTFIGLAPASDLAAPAKPQWLNCPFKLVAILASSNDQATLLLSVHREVMASISPDITSKLWVPVQLPAKDARIAPTTRPATSAAATHPG